MRLLSLSGTTKTVCPLLGGASEPNLSFPSLSAPSHTPELRSLLLSLFIDLRHVTVRALSVTIPVSHTLVIINSSIQSPMSTPHIASSL